MKKLFAILSLILCLCMLASCAGTPVIYHKDCDCPDVNNGTDNNNDNDGKPDVPVVSGSLKTGLAIIANAKNSVAATADAQGTVEYDVTMAAVLVDEDGIIRGCKLDGMSTKVKFDNKGVLDYFSVVPQTKNELGSAYGMVAWGGAVAEWDAQAEALAQFAIGKTVEQFKNSAVDATGKAPAGSDLASSATIYLGGLVLAVEKAASNAKYLGAQGGDTLSLAAVSFVTSSKSATAEKAGTCQLDSTVTALTMKDGVITSCAIDAIQGKVTVDAQGKLGEGFGDTIKTKNELGSAYGMVAWGGAIAEWDAQAAAFAEYVTGKTPEQVAGIAISGSGKPTEADLTSSVTIAIGDFKALIEKAAQ